jgi:hypothetical protein
MRMLVRVDVGDPQSPRLQTFDLRCGFRFDLASNIAARLDVRLPHEGHKRGLEGPAKRIGKVRYKLRREHGLSINENHMAPNLQRWIGKSQFDGFVRCRSLGHEGRAGEQAVAVKLNDGAVDTRSQAEVVGVHDEAAHRPSVPIGTDRDQAGEKVRARTRALV